MLDIYDVTIQICREVGPIAKQIEKSDRDLGRQLRRSLSSVPLNISEGYYSQGGNQRSRYHSAMGSAREALSCLEVAVALGYVEDIDAELADAFDRTVRTLAKLARYRR